MTSELVDAAVAEALLGGSSLAEQIATLPEAERADVLGELTEDQQASLRWYWPFWARAKQVAPAGDWTTWLILAGRGWGKTRTAGEWVKERVEGGARHLIIAGATAGDIRDIIVDGESGILAITPESRRPRYEPSKARLTWPNGARALLLSAEEPERFRGKQCDTFWADELAAWRYPEAWDQLQLGFRLGANYSVTPRGVVSTTPRPTPIIRALIKNARTVVSRGSTYENAGNLTPEFLSKVIDQYEGTRLGRQELHAEVLDDVEGALWSRDLIDRSRLALTAALPQFRRVVVAIDPAVTANEHSDETGIVVAAVGPAPAGWDKKTAHLPHYYVLADLSGRMTPDAWARKAIAAFQQNHCDRVVAEENNGGKLVEANLRTVAVNVPYRGVRAAQGKRTRAEPIAALYEQGRVHHVGVFAKLEDQLCTWEPLTGDCSPDRLDAMVWAVTDLAFAPASPRGLHTNIPTF